MCEERKFYFLVEYESFFSYVGVFDDVQRIWCKGVICEILSSFDFSELVFSVYGIGCKVCVFVLKG